MGRLGGWNSCPGPVSHLRSSLSVTKTSLASVQLCRAAAGGTNVVETVREREKFGFAPGIFRGRTKKLPTA